MPECCYPVSRMQDQTASTVAQHDSQNYFTTDWKEIESFKMPSHFFKKRTQVWELALNFLKITAGRLNFFSCFSKMWPLYSCTFCSWLLKKCENYQNQNGVTYVKSTKKIKLEGCEERVLMHNCLLVALTKDYQNYKLA
jgi:hypothetical protein